MSAPILPPGCVKDCNGCKHRALTKEESLAVKKQFILNAFSEQTQLRDIAPIVSDVSSLAEDSRWNYRERTTLSCAVRDGQWAFGMKIFPHHRDEKLDWKARNKSELLPIPNCPVHSSRVRKVLFALKTLLPIDQFPLVFVSLNFEFLSLVLKCNSEQMFTLNIVTRLAETQKPLQALGIRGLFINLNPSAGNRVFSAKHWLHIWGDHLIALPPSAYGPASFRQCLPALHELAVNEAISFLKPNPKTFVLDLYCGNGNTLSKWQERGSAKLGVEVSDEACQIVTQYFGSTCILRGSVQNRIPQLTQHISNYRSQGVEPLIYANPSRLGLGEEVSKWIGESAKPAKIAYLSCNPLSLAEDVEFLTKAGYLLRRIIPYDFFPQTNQVESLALLEL